MYKPLPKELTIKNLVEIKGSTKERIKSVKQAISL